MRQQKRSKSQWQEIIRQFERSGQSAKAFAAKKDLSIHSLKWWLYRLRKEAKTREPSIKMLPVEISNKVSVSGVEVTCPGGSQIRFASDISPQALADFVKHLEATC